MANTSSQKVFESGRARTSRWRRLGLLLLPVAALAVSACQVRVTPVGFNGYSYASGGNGNVGIYNKPTGDNNEREIMWDVHTPVESNTEASATVVGLHWPDQPGIAVHINNNGSAFETVTENVYGGAGDVFNFHTWRKGVYTLFAQATVPGLAAYAPEPSALNIRVRATASTMQFVVWLPGMAQPAWGDPQWSAQATIPAGAPTSGQTGFYQGHVAAGTWVTYSHMTVDGLPANPLSS
jgi:hypothetical protein